MNKSPDAFRTISEVADFLETPAHVLRFWESRFPQIRPVKRAGGRRYYRPADVALLTGIKRLLHDEGMTIRGVQKILREQGVRHVSGIQDDSSEADDDAALEAALVASVGGAEPVPVLPAAEAETALVIALQTALQTPRTPEDAPPTVSAPVIPWPVTDDPVPDPAPLAADAMAEDLFSRIAPPPLPSQPAPVSKAPAAPDPVAEDPVADAPMAVWAEEADLAQDAPTTAASPAPSPSLRITRIGGTPVEPAPISTPQEAEGPVGPFIASRLRATVPSGLAPHTRQHLADIRDKAVALRDRMISPARGPF